VCAGVKQIATKGSRAEDEGEERKGRCSFDLGFGEQWRLMFEVREYREKRRVPLCLFLTRVLMRVVVEMIYILSCIIDLFGHNTIEP